MRFSRTIILFTCMQLQFRLRITAARRGLFAATLVLVLLAHCGDPAPTSIKLFRICSMTSSDCAVYLVSLWTCRICLFIRILCRPPLVTLPARLINCPCLCLCLCALRLLLACQRLGLGSWRISCLLPAFLPEGRLRIIGAIALAAGLSAIGSITDGSTRFRPAGSRARFGRLPTGPSLGRTL